MIRTLVVAVAVVCAQVAAASTIDTWDFRPHLGTLSKAASGVPLRITANAAGSGNAWSEGAESFARIYASRRGATGRESFATRNVHADELGQVHVRLSQTIAGVPVHGVELIIHADARTGRVLGVNGSFAVDRDLPLEPRTNAWAAIEAAAGAYGIAVDGLEAEPELAYFAGDDGVLRLTWTALARYENEDGPQLDRIYADASTGAALARHSQYPRVASRQVYNCNNTSSLPGTLVRSEGQGNTGNPLIDNAYTNLGLTYDFYKDVLLRNSYNNSNGVQKASIKWSTNYAFAFWNQPLGLVVYGDKYPLPNSLDVTAHEFTHGVIAYSGNFQQSGEPGALGESISDCMAAAAESYRDNGAITANTWTVGEDSHVYRTMDNPTKAYYTVLDPNGPLHDNAGPQNLAFVRLVQGGSNVSAIGMVPAAKIFYRALTAYVTPVTNYRLMRDYTLQAAADLYGINSSQRTSVISAWNSVQNEWASHPGTIATAGTWVYSPEYTTSYAGTHTGHLSGPLSTNFDIYLEYLHPQYGWQTLPHRPDDPPSSSSKETAEIMANAAGTYRWRVQSVSGTGSYQLYINWPK